MYWKENRYYKDEQMANAATLKKELPESGALSAIRLQFYMSNASGIQGYNKARIIDHLTKLEVTNGADKTMFSLRGQQVKALNFYDMGIVPYEKAILYGGQTQRTDVIIPFGRVWKDRDYMLDLAAYDSVYLEVTNDLSATYCANNACKVNVNLLTAEELATIPAKYMKSYEWRAAKPDGDGQYVYHDLPTTELIRRVMVQLDPDLNTNGSAVANPIGDSYSLKYSYLQEKEVVLDHRPKDIGRMNAMDYGLVKTTGRYAQSTTQRYDCAVGDVTNMQMAPMGLSAHTAITTIPTLEESNDRFATLKNIFTGTGSMELIDMVAIGSAYYHTLVLHDSKLAPEEEYLNPKKEAGGKGPVRIAWYGQYDDHTLRTCLSVPIAQGAF